jgi:hypothetical protein
VSDRKGICDFNRMYIQICYIQIDHKINIILKYKLLYKIININLLYVDFYTQFLLLFFGYFFYLHDESYYYVL